MGGSATGKREVTLREVAQEAGVSMMTVSAVINGRAAERRISSATQERVAEIARSMGYLPNAVARALRGRNTNVIGLYSGLGFLSAVNLFLAELIGGLQEGCDASQKDLLLHGTFRGQSVDDIFAKLLDGRIDGLIVQAEASDALVARVAAAHLPIVAVADAIPSIPSVVVDDADGMRQVIAHLSERGHRRIVYVGPRRMIESAARRRQASLKVAAQLGVEVMECSAAPGDDFSQTPLGNWLGEPADRRPSAIAAWSDGLAFEIAAYCRCRGLRIPHDVAVTGFDGFPIHGRQPLTTVRAPWSEVGRIAVARLADEIAARDAPAEIVVPVHLLLGQTT